MNAIVSGRSGRALLLDGESLKSLEFDEPSIIVLRQRSELPYLFGEATDLRTLENTTLESVERELRIDCHFTWALDLILISLDAELPNDIRKEALDGLDELLTENIVKERLENVLYSKPLPEDADLAGAMELCGADEYKVITGVLRIFENYQPTIASVAEAWEAIPSNTFGGYENREAFKYAAVKAGLYRMLATLKLEASVLTF